MLGRLLERLLYKKDENSANGRSPRRGKSLAEMMDGTPRLIVTVEPSGPREIARAWDATDAHRTGEATEYMQPVPYYQTAPADRTAPLVPDTAQAAWNELGRMMDAAAQQAAAEGKELPRFGILERPAQDNLRRHN